MPDPHAPIRVTVVVDHLPTRSDWEPDGDPRPVQVGTVLIPAAEFRRLSLDQLITDYVRSAVATARMAWKEGADA
jgi:hypothetical protein